MSTADMHHAPPTTDAATSSPIAAAAIQQANLNMATSQHQDPSVPSSDGTCYFLKLPVEVRLTIYDYVAPDVTAVQIVPDGRNTAEVINHPLMLTNKEVADGFRKCVKNMHEKCPYTMIVKDFDFRRLIKHLTTQNLLNKQLTLVIRHDVTSNEIEHMKLIVWLKFVKSHGQLRTRHRVVGMPPPATRREFMGQLFHLAQDTSNVMPEIERISEDFMEWWKVDGAENDFV